MEFERTFSVDQDLEVLEERPETFFESAGYELADVQSSVVYIWLGYKIAQPWLKF